MPASLAYSYCGPAPLPAHVWERWNLDPLLIAVLVVATIGFAVGRPDRAASMRFAGAMLTLVVIFLSPLCALTVALFSARVAHHVLLVAVAAPLLCWSVPLRFPPRSGWALSPLVLLHVFTFWLWHAPDAYAAALNHVVIYWLMQVSLLGTAMWAWRAIMLAPAGRAIGALLFLTIQMGLLGAILVFAENPLYLPHLSTTIAFGLDPVSDQQLAGLIMWVPAGIPYVGLALWRLTRALGEHAAGTT